MLSFPIVLLFNFTAAGPNPGNKEEGKKTNQTENIDLTQRVGF